MNNWIMQRLQAAISEDRDDEAYGMFGEGHFAIGQPIPFGPDLGKTHDPIRGWLRLRHPDTDQGRAATIPGRREREVISGFTYSYFHSTYYACCLQARRIVL